MENNADQGLGVINPASCWTLIASNGVYCRVESLAGIE